jgi:malonyl-CoA O-methyltransferase
MATTMLPAREAYERWADTYPAEAHNPLMQVEQSIVARILAHIPSRRTLDVGTGSGRYLPILAESSASVTGVDLSMAMLRRGEGRRICADACRLPFAHAAFDLVNASLMVGDIDDLRAWTREMARVLTAGGHLVYSDFHPIWSARGWQRTFRSADGVLHAVEYRPHTIEQHLEALAAAGLRVIAIREPRLRVERADTPVVAVFHAAKGGVR